MKQSHRARAFVTVVLIGCGVASAESPITPAVAPPAAAAPAGQPPPVDSLLDALHDRGVTLTAFTADVTMTDVNPKFGDSSTRDGHVQYQVKPDGSPRLHVLFDTRHFAKKQPAPDKKEYLLEDGWLTDRSYSDKNETRRQFARPGQKVNLFDLSTGPFPLPIGQEKAAVHKAFDVTLEKADPKTDPPGTNHLLLKPRPGTPLAKQFKFIDVWVDPKLNMPVRIETLDVKELQDRTTEFGKLVVNPALKDADFVLPKVDGMTRHDEPLPPVGPAGK